MFHFLLLLIAADLRRLLRERMVVRSLSFPILLTAGTLVLTLFVSWVANPVSSLALSPDMDTPALQDALSALELEVSIHSDPVGAVERNEAWAGVTMDGIIMSSRSQLALPVEAVIRRAIDSPWQINPPKRPPKPDSSVFGGRIMALLGAIYSLYGVVIGAASLTRDRGDGTLEVGYTLPIARWLFPASRLLSASFVISLFLITGAATFMALVGFDDLSSVLLNGVASILAATSLGVLATSGGGQKQNLSSGLAGGLSMATVLFGTSYLVPSLAAYLPLASLNSSSDGVWPMIVAVLIGVGTSLLFARRSGQ